MLFLVISMRVKKKLFLDVRIRQMICMSYLSPDCWFFFFSCCNKNYGIIKVKVYVF